VSERVRFHLDENVDPDIANAIRRHGVDVTRTAEEYCLESSLPRFQSSREFVAITCAEIFLSFMLIALL